MHSHKTWKQAIHFCSKSYLILVKADIVPVGLARLESYNWNIFKRPKVTLKMDTPISYKLPEEESIENWRKQVAGLTGYELAELEK